jgi:hypothetical protein
MDSAASPAPSHAQPSSDNIPEQPNESSLSNTTPATPEAALKRSYLDLLQPSQVVDLCLALDALVPPAAKESIWPADFSKAIAQLVAASLLNVASPPPPQVGPPAVNGAAGPPGPTAIKSPTPGVAPTPNAVAGPSTTATAVVSAAAPPPLAVHPAAYPSPLARPPSFPHTTSYYGGQAPAFTNPYTMPYGYAPPPVADRPPTKRLDPSHPNAHLGPDDLPSYEEMIVEALEVCGDPEGAPPKTLFQWMENQYPLHSNFRPSASQALQKAFKRGRLTKNEGGKYAISQTWEGGSVSPIIQLGPCKCSFVTVRETYAKTTHPATLTICPSIGQAGHGGTYEPATTALRRCCTTIRDLCLRILWMDNIWHTHPFSRWSIYVAAWSCLLSAASRGREWYHA